MTREPRPLAWCSSILAARWRQAIPHRYRLVGVSSDNWSVLATGDLILCGLRP